MYFYYKFIIYEFDDEVFDTRLMVLKEYLLNSRDGTPYPTELGYVSHVDNHQYRVTYFSTANLTELRYTTRDDREETFSFLEQSFSPVNTQNTLIPLLLNNGTESTNIASSVSFHPSDKTKYIAHLDDGDAEMDCKTGVFDGHQCVAFPVCDEPDTVLPMTENRLNRLVFNNNTSKAYDSVNEDVAPAHATLYVRCDENAVPHVEQCDDGEKFDGTSCVYDPILETQEGLVTNVQRGVSGNLLLRYDSNEVKFAEYGNEVTVTQSLNENVAPSLAYVTKFDLGKGSTKYFPGETKNKIYDDLQNITMKTSKATKSSLKFNTDLVQEESTLNFNINSASSKDPNSSTNDIKSTLNYNANLENNNLKGLESEIDIKDHIIKFKSKRAKAHLVDGLSKREKRALNAAELLPEIKKELEENDLRNYKLHQTKMTFKNFNFSPKPPEDSVQFESLPPPYITPVNDNSSHSCQPCVQFGAGHTFVDSTVSDNQFLECLDDNNLFLHTCTERLKNGPRYYCVKEDVCVSFENGNGELVHGERNDNVSFDTGRTVCRDYNVFEVVECDTGNFVPGIKFNHPLTVELHVNLPKEIYDNDTDECLPFRTNLVHIHRDTFKVDLQNNYDINFSTMAVGRVSKMDNLIHNNSDLHSILTYARDMDEVAINPANGVSIDCTNEPLTVDLFGGKLYTICNNGLVVEAGEMSTDQYFDVNEKRLARNASYAGQCRIADHERYVDLAYRTINGVNCFYTSPLNISNID